MQQRSFGSTSSHVSVVSQPISVAETALTPDYRTIRSTIFGIVVLYVVL